MEVLLSANEQERIDYTVDVEQQLSSPVHEEAKTGRIFEPTTKQIGKILRSERSFMLTSRNDIF